MGFRRFQALLAAAMRWDAREQLAALTVADFPHHKRGQRQRIVSSIRRILAPATEGIYTPSEEAAKAALERFRSIARRQARVWPMPKELRVAPVFDRRGE